jgi:predicted transcriptional regulator
MNAGILIHDTLSALRPSDTVAAALEFMTEQRVSELPVVENNRIYNYARAINLANELPDARLDSVIPFNPHATRVLKHQHLYEIIPMFAAADLEVLAVVNEKDEMIGIIDQRRIQDLISHSLTYKGVGAVLVIRVLPRDFAPSHIMRLVEENGAKVLGMMVYNTESKDMLINLKLNTTLVKGIVASLNRFGYRTEDAYMAEDFNQENNSAYESVLKFFDI